MAFVPISVELVLDKIRLSMNNFRESEDLVENRIGGAPAPTVSFWVKAMVATTPRVQCVDVNIRVIPITD